MIVVTGLSGSGKTTLLKKSKHSNIFFLDDIVKEQMYISSHPLFTKIVEEFGNEVQHDGLIDRKELGKIVFQDPKKLHVLNKLVVPYVQKHLKKLPYNSIVEMAAYLNYNEIYSSFFDHVIIVKRSNPILDGKFDYLPEKTNPIIDREVEGHVIANDGTISEGVSKLDELIDQINMDDESNFF